jgi:hypothetical protein
MIESSARNDAPKSPARCVREKNRDFATGAIACHHLAIAAAQKVAGERRTAMRVLFCGNET